MVLVPRPMGTHILLPPCGAKVGQRLNEFRRPPAALAPLHVINVADQPLASPSQIRPKLFHHKCKITDVGQHISRTSAK